MPKNIIFIQEIKAQSKDLLLEFVISFLLFIIFSSVFFFFFTIFVSFDLSISLKIAVYEAAQAKIESGVRPLLLEFVLSIFLSY